MCWRMCLYGCFVLGIVRTWEVISVLRKVPRNLGSGVGKVPRFRYAFVWRSSEGVRGTLALGRPVFAAMRLRYGGWDCCEPKRKKLRGKHEGIRIGPLTGHMGRGRTSMTNTRRAKARRRFRNRRFRYVTRAAGRGQRCRNGGNLEGTGNRKEPKQNPGNRMISTVSGVQIRAEDTRFELVRLLHQHAFQACAIDH